MSQTAMDIMTRGQILGINKSEAAISTTFNFPRVSNTFVTLRSAVGVSKISSAVLYDAPRAIK